MRRSAVLASLSVAAVAAGLLATSPALASSTPNYCPFSGTQFRDGMQEFTVNANGAGCLVIGTTQGAVSMVDLVAAPGWTYEIKDNDGDRVEVRFANQSTDDRAEVRVEPGKTEVK